MDETTSRPTPADALALLAGGGEMGERIRAFDWSTSPVGPVSDWPHGLKIVVRTMLDSRYAMWLGWGPDFTFFYNDAYARMTLGPKHPWALGKPAREVWPEIWPELSPRAESVLRTGQATWDEGLLLFLKRRGFTEETYHTFSYSPVPDDRGGVGGMLCVVTEDTERTIGERRLRTLREVAARTNDAAKSVEEACEIAARTLAGNPRDLPFVLLYLLGDGGQLSDVECAKLVGTAGLEPGSVPCPREIELEHAPWPLRRVAQTGEAVMVDDVQARFGPITSGAWPEPIERALVLPVAKPGQTRPAGFMVAGISPRLAFTDDYSGFLKLLVGHVASAVASARAYEEERRRAEALAELDRAKTAFFSNVSHEFRTPLTLMLGPVEELLAHSRTNLAPVVKEELEIVNRSGLRLLRLVNTLLDFSRIEAGRVRAVYEPTDLAAFTAELASVFRSACERAGLRLIVDCAPLAEPVFVDREMWEKIVLNLLSNAFKFTFDGQIAVTVRGVGDTAELQVRDTGTGIPAEEMPRLFERFHRVQGAQGRTHEGSGIGLALVQELVKLHGGSVTAQSELGKGTTFTVSLPFNAAHLPADQLGASRKPATTSGANPFLQEALRWLPDHDGNGCADDHDEHSQSPTIHESLSAPGIRSTQDDRPRVLIADDNADMRHYVARLLAGQFQVEAVADGEAALEAARSRHPDLILTDVMMPRLDGFGLLREVRADPRTRGLPVIMLSARAGEESRVEGMEAGADDYLVKPFSAKELLARVSSHVQMARLRREVSDSLRRQSERLRRLAAVATRLNAALDVTSITGVVTEEARDLIGSHQAVTSFTVDQNWGQAINTVSLSQTYALSRSPEERPDGSGIESLVCRTNRPLRMTQAELERHPDYPSFARRAAECPPLRGWLAAPLVARDGRNVGLIQLSDKCEGDFIEEDEAILVQLAQMASVALENARLVQDLRDSDRRKDEFLATLAHELRNPLAPIRNAIEVLRMTGSLDPTTQTAHEMIDRQINQLVRLVDDLLDVSRITRGKLPLRKERVELAAAVRSAVETARPLIEAAGHEFTLILPPEPVFLDADLVRLAQVVANLLTNAAKYTDKGGHIRLTAEQQGDQIVLSVKDTGIGIAADHLPRVFDMFSQVASAIDRSQGGLGIGLSLVKGLVQMHGGTVDARSEGLGKGSEFVVRLPLGKPCGRQFQAGHANGNRQPGRRVLVVDDNRDAADSLGMLLRLLGHQAQVAHDGPAALEAADKLRPDVMLLDIGLPGMNGYEVARRIRDKPWGRGIVLVATTGWGQEEDKRRAAEVGFDHHLTKPVALADLQRLISTVGIGAVE
jgi:signal transduction histidine kinase